MEDKYLGRDEAPVSAECWKLLDATMIGAAKSQMAGRRIVAMEGPFGFGLKGIPLGDCENEDGAVEVQMSKMGSMQINNRRSDVEVYLPDKAAFQLDARTKNGEIQSDFAGLKISNQEEQGVASGIIGGGGPLGVGWSSEHAASAAAATRAGTT